MTSSISTDKKNLGRLSTRLRSTQPYSLLTTQRFLLSQEEQSETSGLNLEQVAVQFDEAIDEKAFIESVQHVTRSHDALCVRFDSSQPDSPSQQLEIGVVPSIRAVQADGEAVLEQVLAEEREQGFDLSQPSSMRIVTLGRDHRIWGLVWTVHRIVADSASLEIVLRQVIATYEEIVAGREPAKLEVTSLEALVKREHDFSSEQQADRAEAAKSVQQWIEDAGAPSPLPLDFKAQQRSHKFLVVQREIDEASYAQVRNELREAEIDEGTLVQLAWGVLLGRYGAKREVLFGGSFSARDSKEFGELSDFVGPLGIRVPVSVELDPGQIVSDALRGLQAQQQTMRQRHWNRQEIQPTLTGLVQTDVTHNRNRSTSESSKGSQGQRRQFVSSSPWGCPLSLMVRESETALSVSLNYDTGVYDLQSGTQLLDDYCHILVTLTEHLNQPLGELDFMAPGMREQLIDQQCAREQSFSHPSALTRIMEQCEVRPAEIAISDFHQTSVTYGELGQRITQLAQTLHGHGVRAGDIVAIHVERSIEAVVSMLAAHAAGAAFLPLDVTSPADRRVYMLEDARVRLVLMDGSAELNTDVKTLRVDQVLDAGFKSPFEKLPSEPTPADGLAYVIYTSGSTGKPKGVCIEHRSLANHITQTAALFELTTKDRWLQFSSLSFDSSMEEIFVSLAMGASLWLRSDDMVASARSFFERLEEKRVTVVTLTTAFWHQLVHSQTNWPESLRLVLVGGERVDPGLHARFREVVGKEVRFINSYGPTEATVACTSYDDNEGDHDTTVLPIGRPMGGASGFVLDENLKPVPFGVEGQLYVGGAGLARGYLYRETLTAERFIAHPFRPNARLYATGDVVRYTSKGNLVYIDRIDHQVKVQGFRVELGEIETRLRSHQAVEEAVVVAVSFGGTKRLMSFVQVPDSGQVAEDELQEFVRDALPAFMVPRRIEILPVLPHTPAGKVDRPALATMSAELSKQSSGEQETVGKIDDPLHEKLLGIWSEMLQHPISDPSADFFDVGGDSLMAVRLFVEIEKELQVQCNPQKFFSEPTVKALAELIRDDDKSDFKAPLVTLAEGPADVRPLFFAPTLSGQVADYFYLVELLKGVVPMFGLQMRGLRKGEEIHSNLRDAAEFYIERMREVQPQGPYCLAGYSAGGTICLAIAEALHEQGETTDLLLMLDAVPPDVHIASPLSSPRRLWRLGCTTIDRFKELFEGENFVRNLIDRAKPPIQRLWAKVWPFAKEPEVHVEDLFQRSGMSKLTAEESTRMQAHLETTIDFQPRNYPLSVVLVRSNHDPFEGPFEYDLGWSQAITGDTEIEVVTLRHNDFLGKNHIEPVAEILKKYLNARTR